MADFFAARIEYRVEYSTVQHRTIQKTLGNSMACGFCGGAEHSTHHHENRRDFRFGLSQTESKVCFDFFVSSFSLRSLLWLEVARRWPRRRGLRPRPRRSASRSRTRSAGRDSGSAGRYSRAGTPGHSCFGGPLPTAAAVRASQSGRREVGCRWWADAGGLGPSA